MLWIRLRSGPQNFKNSLKIYIFYKLNPQKFIVSSRKKNLFMVLPLHIKISGSALCLQNYRLMMDERTTEYLFLKTCFLLYLFIFLGSTCSSLIELTMNSVLFLHVNL